MLQFVVCLFFLLRLVPLICLDVLSGTFVNKTRAKVIRTIGLVWTTIHVSDSNVRLKCPCWKNIGGISRYNFSLRFFTTAFPTSRQQDSNQGKFEIYQFYLRSLRSEDVIQVKEWLPRLKFKGVNISTEFWIVYADQTV